MQSNDMHHFFKEHFRLKRDTFLKLCEILAPHMTRQSTQLRDAVPLPIRVAIGLRRLGKGDSFESISVEFGVGESTVHGICTGFEDILSKMAPVYIKFPVDQDEAKRIIMKFEEKYSILKLSAPLMVVNLRLKPLQKIKNVILTENIATVLTCKQ